MAIPSHQSYALMFRRVTCGRLLRRFTPSLLTCLKGCNMSTNECGVRRCVPSPATPHYRLLARPLLLALLLPRVSSTHSGPGTLITTSPSLTTVLPVRGEPFVKPIHSAPFAHVLTTAPLTAEKTRPFQVARLSLNSSTGSFVLKATNVQSASTLT